MPRYRQETSKMSPADALDAFKSGAEEIKEELQEWHDSIPESLQGGEKAGALDEAVSEIEDVLNSLPDDLEEILDRCRCVVFPVVDSVDPDGVTVYDSAEDLEPPTLDVQITMRTGKKRGSGESRAMRLANAVAHGRAVHEWLEGWCNPAETWLEAHGGAPEGEEKESGTETEALIRELYDDVLSACSDLDDYVSRVDGVEIPGMMG